ncbi:glyceraldehyde 3-phosphate dehydrogenase NAD-binding domain-containing protein, partial [Mycoplasmopsis bovis]
MKRVAINGFGRIGRLALRYLLDTNNIKLVNCIKMNKNGKNMLFVS